MRETGHDAQSPDFTRRIYLESEGIEASLAGLRAHGGELVGELEDYENSYWLCYVRGPAGIIVELAEKIGCWGSSLFGQ